MAILLLEITRGLWEEGLFYPFLISQLDIIIIFTKQDIKAKLKVLKNEKKCNSL